MMEVKVTTLKNIKGQYAHWAEKPADLDTHEPLLVPQSVMDGWQCWCSCGQEGWFASFYEFDKKEDLLAALKSKHAEHVKEALK